jgi:L-fuconolactonase
LRAAARNDLVICVFAPGNVPDIQTFARAHPELQVVVDHLGLAVPDVGAPPMDHFADLSSVLELAQLPNIVVKLTGAPALSHEPFPFSDLWAPVMRLVDAFGPSRLMWGTDWTRVPNATYSEGVRYFGDSDRFSARDKEQMMGTTLRRVFDWAPA